MTPEIRYSHQEKNKIIISPDKIGIFFIVVTIFLVLKIAINLEINPMIYK